MKTPKITPKVTPKLSSKKSQENFRVTHGCPFGPIAKSMTLRQEKHTIDDSCHQ